MPTNERCRSTAQLYSHVRTCLVAMKEFFQQSTYQFINKLEEFRAIPGEGVETIFGRFNDSADVVEEDGADTLAMLGIKFHSHLPANIKSGMALDYKDEGKQRKGDERGCR